jgi:hypothetical protein
MANLSVQVCSWFESTYAAKENNATTTRPEMEFLGINLKKDSSLLLHFIHSLFYSLYPVRGDILHTWTDD